MTLIQAKNSGILSHLMKQLISPSTKRYLIVLLASLIVTLASSNSYAVVKFFDGFGDADLDNDGTPLTFYDVDVGDDSCCDDPNFENASLTYVPGRLQVFDPNGIDPKNLNPEITSVLDANDKGIPWFQMRGWTGDFTGNSKPTARIIDDAQGAMLDTAAIDPNLPGALGNTAIDSGYALSVNARGRG